MKNDNKKTFFDKKRKLDFGQKKLSNKMLNCRFESPIPI